MKTGVAIIAALLVLQVAFASTTVKKSPPPPPVEKSTKADVAADIGGKVASTKAAVDAKINSTKTALEAKVSAVESKVAGTKAAVDAKINSTKTALEAKVSAVESKVASTKAAVDAKINSTKTALETKVSAIESKVTGTKAAVDAKINSTKTAIETKTTEAKDAATKDILAKVDALKASADATTKDLESKVTAAKTSITEKLDDIKASAKNATESLVSKVDGLKADSDKNAQAKMDSLKADADNATSSLEKKVDSLKSDISSKVDDIKGKATNVTTDFSKKVEDLKMQATTILLGKVDAVSGKVEDVKGKAANTTKSLIKSLDDMKANFDAEVTSKVSDLAGHVDAAKKSADKSTESLITKVAGLKADLVKKLDDGKDELAKDADSLLAGSKLKADSFKANVTIKVEGLKKSADSSLTKIDDEILKIKKSIDAAVLSVVVGKEDLLGGMKAKFDELIKKFSDSTDALKHDIESGFKTTSSDPSIIDFLASKKAAEFDVLGFLSDVKDKADKEISSIFDNISAKVEGFKLNVQSLLEKPTLIPSKDTYCFPAKVDKIDETPTCQTGYSFDEKLNLCYNVTGAECGKFEGKLTSDNLACVKCPLGYSLNQNGTKCMASCVFGYTETQVAGKVLCVEDCKEGFIAIDESCVKMVEAKAPLKCDSKFCPPLTKLYMAKDAKSASDKLTPAKNETSKADYLKSLLESFKEDSKDTDCKCAITLERQKYEQAEPEGLVKSDSKKTYDFKEATCVAAKDAPLLGMCKPVCPMGTTEDLGKCLASCPKGYKSCTDLLGKPYCATSKDLLGKDSCKFLNDNAKSVDSHAVCNA